MSSNRRYHDSVYRKAKRAGAKVITIEPFGAEVFLFRGVSAFCDQFEKIFGVTPSPPDPRYVMGFYGAEDLGDGEGVHVICVGDEHGVDYPEDVIWHEALHCTVCVLDQFGVRFDVENHELYAYTQGFIARSVRELLFPEEGMNV